MKGQRGRIFRSSNRTGRNKDEGGEGERGFGRADTEICQRCAEILGIGKLLSPVHRRVCISSEAIT